MSEPAQAVVAVAPPPEPVQPLTFAAKCYGLLALNSQAAFVYLLYATLILVTDFKYSVASAAAFHSGPFATTGTGDGTDDYYYLQVGGAYLEALGRTNTMFIVAGSIHLFNALQYVAVWPCLGRGWLSYVMVPEYLNVLGATLYLYTAGNYSRLQATGPGRYLDTATMQSHRIETAAAVIELFATFGWCHVWWHTHERGEGRGFTLVDPELLALVFTVAPSFLYVAYNSMVMTDPTSYYSSEYVNSLFTNGDIVYFVGAFFYVLVAFRDAGFYSHLGELVQAVVPHALALRKQQPIASSQ